MPTVWGLGVRYVATEVISGEVAFKLVGGSGEFAAPSSTKTALALSGVTLQDFFLHYCRFSEVVPYNERQQN